MVSQGLNIEPRGPILSLWQDPAPARFPEILIEGPAGTGKTYGVWFWIHTLCKEVHGLRVLVVRKTLKSIRQSMQPTYEDKIVKRDHTFWHQVLKGPKRNHRTSYIYPRTGAEIILAGLDDVGNLDSVEADIVWIEEGRHVAFSDYDRLKRCLRNHAIPWQALLITTNPGSDGHWLAPNRSAVFPMEGYREAPAGGAPRLRLLSRHDDNPTVTPAYLELLKGMSGAQRAQLYEGRWVGESGRVWPTFDPDFHVHDLVPAKVEAWDWWLVHPKTRKRVKKIKGFASSFDPGYRAPGCFAVWAITEPDRAAYCVAECYATGMQKGEWAKTIEELHAEFGFKVGIVDCADPEMIDILNASLSKNSGSTVGQIMRGADKTKGKLWGVDVARWALGQGLLNWIEPEHRMRGVWRQTVGNHWQKHPWPDDSLEHKPKSTTEEIPGYIFVEEDIATTEEARAERAKSEKPSKKSADHGCDQTIYLATHFFGAYKPTVTLPDEPEEPLPETAWVHHMKSRGWIKRHG